MNSNRPRKAMVASLIVGLGTVMACSGPAEEIQGPVVTVYATPTCGCCSKWVRHLRSAGFDASKVNVDDLDAVRRKHGVTADLSSCHTAIVNDYVVEGHVPADVIRKLLAERPNVVGIAVPDMPIGSPGMEVRGQPAENYDVLAFDREGNVSVFARR